MDLTFVFVYFFVIMKCVESHNIKLVEDYKVNPRFNSCLSEIIKNHVNNKEIVLINEEIEDDKYGKIALHLDWPKTVLKHNFEGLRNIEGVFILFPDTNFTTYSKLFKKSSHSYSLQYLIVTENFIKMITIFDKLWSFNILNVVALYQSKSGKQYIFTFFPFSSRGCSSTYPTKVNTWNQSINGFVTKGNIFSNKKKLYNLNGCPIRISLKDKPSNALLEINKDKNNGISIKLFNYIKERMNFTAHVVETDREANAYAAAYFNFTSASVQSVLKGRSDIGLGRFSQLLDYDKNIVSPLQLSIDCFTWAVPIKAGAEPSMWTIYAFEFDLYTWILLIFSHLVVVTFLHFIFQFKHIIEDQFANYFNIFYSFGFSIGIALKLKPTVTSLRLFYIHWILFCFVIISAYQASMGSLVTVPPDSANIDATSDLLKTNFTLTGEPKMYYVLSASSETSEIIKEVLNRFEILLPGEFHKIIYKLYRKRDMAVFYTKNKLEQAEGLVREEWNISKAIHIIPGCMISSHSSAVIMKKGSLYNEPFKHYMSALLEGGILQFWSQLNVGLDFDKTKKLKEGTELKVRKFSLKHAKGVLIIIVCGHLLSTFVFLIELLSKGITFKGNVII